MTRKTHSRTGRRLLSRGVLPAVVAGWIAGLTVAAGRAQGPAEGSTTGSTAILLAFLWLAGGLLLVLLALVSWLVLRHRSHRGGEGASSRDLRPRQRFFGGGESDVFAYRLLVEGSQDLMQQVDAEGALLMTNLKWKETLGYGDADSSDLSIWQVVDPDHQEAYRRSVESLSEQVPAVQISTVFRSRAGEPVELEGMLQSCGRAAGRTTLGIFRLPPETVEIEVLKRRLLSAVGHELRSPLTALIGALDLLAGSPAYASLADQQMELLEISRRNGERLLVLVNDLMDLQKLYAGTLNVVCEPCPVKELVSDTVTSLEDLSRNQSVDVVTRWEGEEVEVSADARRLRQALRNLLTDALRSSPQGEQVEVSVSTTSPWAVITIDSRCPGFLEEIVDVGEALGGSAEATAPKKSSDDSFPATLARKLVGLMDGRVRFESPEAGHTRALVELPVCG